MIVYKIFHGNDLPIYVESLSTCIFANLDVSTEEVFISRVRENSLRVRLLTDVATFDTVIATLYICVHM